MDFFKELVWQNAIEEALSLLFTKMPLLGIGPLAPLVTWVVTKLTDVLYEKIKMLVDVKSVALKNDGLRREWEISNATLYHYALEYGEDSPQFKEERNAHKDHWRKLVSLTAK